MAQIECKSSQTGIRSVFVDIEYISNEDVKKAYHQLNHYLQHEEQISNGVARAFVELTKRHPMVNPSDIWQHIIYRYLITKKGWSEQRWKRVSGFALERAFIEIYRERLSPLHLRMRILTSTEANKILETIGIHDIKSSKIDLFIEGEISPNNWIVFGAAHVKSSIAERIQDDVPASVALMEHGILSVALTMDAKSYPPPHGNCINYGELGGRTMDIDKNRIKRNYIEIDGQFDGLFSFNLRTPPSPENTISGKRIFTMSLHDEQPDQFVMLLSNRWQQYINNL